MTSCVSPYTQSASGGTCRPTDNAVLQETSPFQRVPSPPESCVFAEGTPNPEKVLLEEPSLQHLSRLRVKPLVPHYHTEHCLKLLPRHPLHKLLSSGSSFWLLSFPCCL